MKIGNIPKRNIDMIEDLSFQRQLNVYLSCLSYISNPLFFESVSACYWAKYPGHTAWYILYWMATNNRCARKGQSLLFDLYKAFDKIESSHKSDFFSENTFIIINYKYKNYSVCRQYFGYCICIEYIKWSRLLWQTVSWKWMDKTSRTFCITVSIYVRIKIYGAAARQLGRVRGRGSGHQDPAPGNRSSLQRYCMNPKVVWLITSKKKY